MNQKWFLLLLLLSGKSEAKGMAQLKDITKLSTKFDSRPFMDPRVVDTIVVHQTDMSDKDGIPAIKNNPEVWKNIKSNFGIDASGTVYQVNETLRNTMSSNGWNGRSVAIETDGAYYGIEGDERTFRRDIKYFATAKDANGKPIPELDAAGNIKKDSDGNTIYKKVEKHLIRKPTKLSQGTKDGLELAIATIINEVAAKGGKIRYLVTHRQSSEDRVSDPGQAIYQVMMQLAAKYGLDTRIDVYKGSGYPIPVEWDYRSKHGYFDFVKGKRV